jgi:hypothetical protein
MRETRICKHDFVHEGFGRRIKGSRDREEVGALEEGEGVGGGGRK